MQRREVFSVSFGALITSTIGAAVVSTRAYALARGEDKQAARRYDRERRFADVAAGRIAYIDRGKGPAVLFLHGFPLSSFQWRGVIDRLSSDRRCVAPDWLGVYPDLWLEPWLRHKDVARSPGGLGGMCYGNPAHPTDAALEQYLGPLVQSPVRKALVNQYALGLTPNPLEGLAAKLRKCEVPTRIIWGTGDTIFSDRNPGYLAGLLPRCAGIRRVEGAKLFFPEEYPGLIAEEARLLWDRTV